MMIVAGEQRGAVRFQLWNFPQLPCSPMSSAFDFGFFDPV